MSFIILMIFVTLAKYKNKIPWRWCGCIETYRSYIQCFLYIQGVARLVDITAGGDFLGLCDQKSSYKHVSDFGRLRHFFIPVHALVWTASSESAGGWRTQLGGLSFALQALFIPPPLPSYRQSSFLIPTLGRYLRNAGKVGWVGIRLASVYCTTQLLLLRVQKPLSLTLQWLCRLVIFRTVGRQFRKGVGERSDSVACLLVPYVFSSRCVCYVHDAIYIFSGRVCRYDLCVRFLWR